MEKKFEFLDHTGDVKIRAYGSNMGEKFMHTALAVSSIMIDPSTVQAKIERTINLEEKDLKALLYSFIEELLFLLDAEAFLLSKFKSCAITQKNETYKLEAKILGDINTGQYTIEGGVKAATYSEMEINENYIQMVVDI